MRKTRLVSCGLLIVLLLAACAPATAPVTAPPAPAAVAPAPVTAPAVPARAPWEDKWDKTLAEAKKETRVVINTSLSATVRAVMAEGFKKAYGISIESIAGRADAVAKLLAERRAGLYMEDVYISGSTSALTQLKPVGAIDPLEPAFILPDLTDTELIKKVWYQGTMPWVDADHTNLVPAPVVTFSVAMNTDLVKEGEIKSYRDLLNPKWQGKLLSDDPTTTGIGNNFFVFAESAMGWDYLVELVKAKPTLTRDQRLALDWLAHGKVALLIGPRVDLLAELTRLGAPVKGIIPAEGTFVFGGSTNLSIINKPAHPNAARIFINWYLSKEGQSIVIKEAGYQSARLDVPTDYLSPEQVRKPGVKYFIIDDEKLVLTQPARLKKIQELVAPLLK